MVEGLGRFANHFASFTDQYTLIGGAACDLAMQSVSQPFRATKDLDIVLLLETLNANFVTAFWNFVGDGAYQTQELESGQRRFYRFMKPGKADFPAMLELFSRLPDAITFEGTGHLTPIPMDETVSSLSAILLDVDYYGWVQTGKQVANNLSFVRAEHLIPLKAKAWLDLSERKSRGEYVNSTDIKKHKNDVFRLLTIMDPEYLATPPRSIIADMTTFVARIQNDPPDLRSLGIKQMTLEQTLQQLIATYGK